MSGNNNMHAIKTITQHHTYCKQIYKKLLQHPQIYNKLLLQHHIYRTQIYTCNAYPVNDDDGTAYARDLCRPKNQKEFVKDK